jgi:hypothetical protein
MAQAPGGMKEGQRVPLNRGQSARRLACALAVLALSQGHGAVAAESASGQGLPPLTLGPFTLDPRLVVTLGYDDNVFATPDNEQGDDYLVISPSLRATAQGSDYRVVLRGGVDLGRYADFVEENYNDVWVQTGGQYQLAPGSLVFGGLDYYFEHEDRSSPDAVFGSEPTTYNDVEAHLGLSQRLAPVTLRLGGTLQWLDFNDTPAVGGSINEDDRDRVQTELGARMLYELSDALRPFVQGTADIRRYQQTPDDAGYERDSTGFRLSAGAIYQPAESVELEGFLGVMHQGYLDERFDPFWAPAFGARLSWQTTPRASLIGNIDRTLEETTQTGASSYLYTEYGLDLLYRLAPGLTANLHGSFSSSDYNDIDRVDDFYEVGWGIKQFITPNIFVALDHSYLRRDSTLAEADYDENVFFARIGAQWSPGYRETDSEAPPGAAVSLAGLYVGADLTLTDLETRLLGPRGQGRQAGQGQPDAGRLQGLALW